MPCPGTGTPNLRNSPVVGPNDDLGAMTVTGLLPSVVLVVPAPLLGGATVVPAMAPAVVIAGRDGACRTSLGGAGPPGGAWATHCRARRRPGADAGGATAALTRAPEHAVLSHVYRLPEARAIHECAFNAGA